ncbi:MAG: glutathione S-transferase N-terminal domain-containing protein [Gammaproteobacteria bacterium]|nr:glutathione S-transferase N-terminal domain-containing protein [Gammaproteobacteria bacterium]
MGVVANRRSMMLLFTGDTDIYSHRIRLVMAEKGVNAEMVSVAPNERNEDLIELNPYNSLPTLIDRDLVLYGSQVIMEYIDERFPHPPLMPVDPVSRATNRLMLYRIEVDLFSHLNMITSGTAKQADKARKELRDNLIAISPAFEQLPYFMSEEFSLIDCSLAPLLWRLEELGISLPKQADPLVKYAEKIFSREAFKESLTELEGEMRV